MIWPFTRRNSSHSDELERQAAAAKARHIKAALDLQEALQGSVGQITLDIARGFE